MKNGTQIVVQADILLDFGKTFLIAFFLFQKLCLCIGEPAQSGRSLLYDFRCLFDGHFDRKIATFKSVRSFLIVSEVSQSFPVGIGVLKGMQVFYGFQLRKCIFQLNVVPAEVRLNDAVQIVFRSGDA
jgi:hypothetical protein